MREVFPDDEKEFEQFAETASKYFKENPHCYTYAEGDPAAGQLLAIRWNTMAVLILRVDGEFEPLIYTVRRFIGDDLPPLKPESYQ